MLRLSVGSWTGRLLLKGYEVMVKPSSPHFEFILQPATNLHLLGGQHMKTYTFRSRGLVEMEGWVGAFVAACIMADDD